MKLSQYAKKLGVCYKTAWRYWKAHQIPGAYQLPSGTVIVPDSAIPVYNKNNSGTLQ
jgi:putative resolvase